MASYASRNPSTPSPDVVTVGGVGRRWWSLFVSETPSGASLALSSATRAGGRDDVDADVDADPSSRARAPRLLRDALPALARLVHSNDEEVLTDACWALSYLSDGTNDKIQAVIEAGVCRRLVELLGSKCPSVLIPALRTVGNIVTGDDHQTQCVLNCGARPRLLALLNRDFESHLRYFALVYAKECIAEEELERLL